MTLLTEKEAAEKWCPKVQVAMSQLGTETRRISNRGDDHESLTCIGSRCMAWRVGVYEHQRNLTPENRTPGVGYCGAFGKVEP